MRRISRRTLSLGVAIVTALTGLVVLGSASPAMAAGCRAAPYSAEPYLWNVTGSLRGVQQYDYGTYTTTSQCVDINLDNIGAASSGFGTFYACVVFVSTTNACNYWTYMPYGQWKDIATNVKDGTRF